MEFLLSGRFIMGLILGAVIYHYWMLRQAKRG